MKKIVCLLFSSICFFLSACNKMQGGSLLDQIMAKGELVIATEGFWAPWTFYNGKRELTGYDVDVAKEICKRLGVRPRFVEVEWELVFNCLETRECDIVMSGVSLSDDRLERFYFSHPYAYSKMAVIVRMDNDEIKSFEDLKGRVCANSIGSNYISTAIEYGAMVIEINSFDDAISLLVQNRSEATINSDLTLYNYLKTNSDVPIKVAALSDTPAPMAIPCRKEQGSLSFLEQINRILEDMRSDGTLSDISYKYFDMDITE